MQSTRDLRVPLPDLMYQRLRNEVERSNRPATELAREAIDMWLTEQQRLFVHESVAAYALEVAGTSSDIDLHLEAAGIDNLMSLDSSDTENPS